MGKINTLFPELQALEAEKSFSIEKTGCGKKIRLDYDAPDLPSNGVWYFLKVSTLLLLIRSPISFPTGEIRI